MARTAFLANEDMNGLLYTGRCRAVLYKGRRRVDGSQGLQSWAAAQQCSLARWKGFFLSFYLSFCFHVFEMLCPCADGLAKYSRVSS